MQDNSLDTIEALQISGDEIDMLCTSNSEEYKEYSLFEVPLLFLYNNEETGTFAEFELDGVDAEIAVVDAIALFMQRVTTFGKVGCEPLPDTLISKLNDAELDSFMLAHRDKALYKAIESMIYIQKAGQYYRDSYGFEYIVAGVGINDAILWYEQDAKLLTLHTTPSQIQHQGEKLYVTHNDSL